MQTPSISICATLHECMQVIFAERYGEYRSVFIEEMEYFQEPRRGARRLSSLAYIGSVSFGSGHCTNGIRQSRLD